VTDSTNSFNLLDIPSKEVRPRGLILHEFIHVAAYTINGDFSSIPRWLLEGIAYYEAQQFDDNQRKYLANKSIPSLSRMETANSYDFGEMRGYQLSYTNIEFMVKKFWL
jgi:hypothetical protein